MGKIIQSIDVGSGFTKYVTKQIGRDISCALFPSVAKAAVGGLKSFQKTGIGAKQTTICVEVKGNKYEVGPDVDVVGASRQLDDNYSASAAHEALLLGALSFVGKTNVDLLMLGLPVHTFEQNREKLIEKFTGELFTWDQRTGERVVTKVNRVEVVPQPLGALYNYGIFRGEMDRVKRGNNLIIDPGMNTLDWWVSEGLKPKISRCDSGGGIGMWSVLQLLADKISEDHFDGRPLDPNVRIDHALRTDWLVTLYQKDIDLKNYKSLIQSKIDQNINEMFNSIKTIADIDNILVAGGAGVLFGEVIKQRLPDNKVTILPDSIYSNVKGFQGCGMAIMGEL